VVLALVAAPGLLAGRGHLQRHDGVGRQVPKARRLAVGRERRGERQSESEDDERRAMHGFSPVGADVEKSYHAASERTTAGNSSIDRTTTLPPVARNSSPSAGVACAAPAKPTTRIPAACPAVTPRVESSITMQLAGGSPSVFAASR